MAARAHNGGIGIADDENGRRRDLALAQSCDQFQSAHRGHALVDDEAVAIAEVAGTEKVGAAAIGAHREAVEFERKFQRIADRRIVVDDGDDRRYAPSSGIAASSPEKWREATAAALIWLKSAREGG